jgi:hypothetical protein
MLLVAMLGHLCRHSHDQSGAVLIAISYTYYTGSEGDRVISAISLSYGHQQV